MEIIKSVILGIIEGITEWLPISSTGHMILVDEFLKLDVTPEFKDFFFVAIQLGAILAVIILFWNKIWPFHLKSTAVKPWFVPEGHAQLGAFKRFCNNYVYVDKFILWFKIAVACIPAAIIGLKFDDEIDAMLTGDSRAYVVAAALIFYGIVFIIVESVNKKEKILSTDDITYKTALLIGLMQCLALVPGTSRSGTTILGAMLLGASRVTASEFSFFLSIPAMVGGSGIRLLKYLLDGNGFLGSEVAVLAVGTVAAFIVSWFAIKFLMSFIRKHDFKAFGVYRIVLGIAVILYFAIKK